ncbi:Protoheme IX farnesyltransferase [Rhodotorula toruloides ATCC 204091]|uniref:Protoheme IX farnesyltransferase, mitochondrial n=1 Tax=Rhodotorula toruloides TaxID=5286 RepID=A0A0K3CML4_RHOTO|nr:Protoheme IX farnesyltransferase [Rhodotorula toruloides ATCC 204091]KAK4331052.1 Protoheme IX farnesyltransferase, mitochondrial [Rhodotorula toruloides]PRQ70354.1 Protoheme IX farnesyltransferase [Rhodotorula toruloides]
MLSRLAARQQCALCVAAAPSTALRTLPIIATSFARTRQQDTLATAWKGKGRAYGTVALANGTAGRAGAGLAGPTRWTRGSLAGGLAGGRTGLWDARRWASSQAKQTDAASGASPVYAHEDLLLPSSTGRRIHSRPASPARHRDPKAFFSPSYLVAEEPPLPPPSTSPLVPLSTPIPAALPPTVLSNGLPNPDIRWRAPPQTTIRDDIQLYKALGKFKLSSLVVLTTMAGYAMCPVDPSTTAAAMDAFAQSLGSSIPSDTSLLPAATNTLGASPANNLTLSVLLPTTVGTTLCAFSAAAFNQLIEAPYDAQMARTRNRPLPKRTVTPLHAATYGALTGSVGLATLYAMNPLSAFLGLFTIVLYCPLYTISKRHSVYNTWIGSVVGAIPPLIGWAACTASVDPISQPGAWALFGLMFAWQFPHFMSLAHTLRSSYASSGYRMLAVLDPPKNALVSLRYSLALIPLCAAFPYLGLTNAAFAYLSLLPNGLLAVAAWRFWKKREERRAKELFWASLVQLPVILALAMACKKGLWGEDENDEEV